MPPNFTNDGAERMKPFKASDRNLSSKTRREEVANRLLENLRIKAEQVSEQEGAASVYSAAVYDRLVDGSRLLEPFDGQPAPIHQRHVGYRDWLKSHLHSMLECHNPSRIRLEDVKITQQQDGKVTSIQATATLGV